ARGDSPAGELFDPLRERLTQRHIVECRPGRWRRLVRRSVDALQEKDRHLTSSDPGVGTVEWWTRRAPARDAGPGNRLDEAEERVIRRHVREGTHEVACQREVIAATGV